MFVSIFMSMMEVISVKKLFLLGLIALNSSIGIAADQFCNPCWMVEQIKANITHAKKASEISKLNELIEAKFGPACQQYQDELVAQRTQDIYRAGCAALCMGGILLVGLTIIVVYNKFTDSGKSEEVGTEDIQV